MIIAKRMLGPVLEIILLLVSAVAASSAPFRTRQTVSWFGTSLTNSAIIKQEQAEDCRLAGENLPAELDANGHWGFSSEGFQLGLRFEKPVFMITEPVVASLIVRNVSGDALGDSIALPDKTEFVVTSEKGEPLNRIDIFRPNPTEEEERRRTFLKSFSFDLEPGEQWKYKMVLTDMYDLRAPGTYRLQAKRRIWKPDRTAGEIISGTATIQIVAGSAASGPIKTDAVLRPVIPVSALEGTQTSHSTTPSTPGNNPQPDASPSSSESGGSLLGVVSGAVRIGASVLVLLIAAALAFLLIRRARRHS